MLQSPALPTELSEARTPPNKILTTSLDLVQENGFDVEYASVPDLARV